MPEKEKEYIWYQRSTNSLVVWNYSTSYLMACINDVESDFYFITEL